MEKNEENRAEDQEDDFKIEDITEPPYAEYTDLPAPSKKKEEKPVQHLAEQSSPKKDTILFYALGILLLAIILIIAVPKFTAKEPLTIEELHNKNFQGKLNPDEGYMYNGHSFVHFDNLWYGLIIAPQINKSFSIPFHYGPREVEDIAPEGALNYSNLQRYKSYYNTFDPLDDSLGHIGTSIGEANAVLTSVFGRVPIAACLRNQTKPTENNICATIPTIDCDSTKAPVFYYASENRTQILFIDNCAIVTGDKQELFRATDRMLFDMLGIMTR